MKIKKNFIYLAILTLMVIILFIFITIFFPLRNLDNSPLTKFGGDSYAKRGPFVYARTGSCAYEDFDPFCQSNGYWYKRLVGTYTFSFEVLNAYYAKDKNNAYFLDKLIKEADPKTFTALGELYAKDKNNVYLGELPGRFIHTLNSADPLTFKVFSKSLYRYTKDKNNVYFEGALIEGADSTTFEDLGEYYARDKNYVYSKELIVKGADPKSFKVLSVDYTKDKNNVYFRKFYSKSPEILESEDPNTFQVK